MKKMLTACALALTAVVGLAQTTTDRQGVTTNTDPAKAAAVERQGADIKAQDRVATSTSDKHQVKAHSRRHHRHHKAAVSK